MVERTCYTIGVISSHLIQTEKQEEASDKDAALKETLNKLPVIKGGIESRFIPSFDQKTKDLIEGFFKITKDTELREYALSSEDKIECTVDDTLL